MNHSLSQKIKKISAYSIIASQLLTSTHYLSATEFSPSLQTPRKIVPFNLEIVTPQNAASHQIVPEETLTALGSTSAENQNAPLNADRRVHPLNEDDRIPDDASVNSDDQPRASEEDLKKFDTYLNNNLRSEFSKKDYALFAGVLLGTAILGYGYKFDNMGEIFAEARMWTDNFFLTFAGTVEGYRFLYMTDKNDPFFHKMNVAQEWNSYLFLTPYVATRLYAMASDCVA